jgi:hypothetical protein
MNGSVHCHNIHILPVSYGLVCLSTEQGACCFLERAAGTQLIGPTPLVILLAVHHYMFWDPCETRKEALVQMRCFWELIVSLEESTVSTEKAFSTEMHFSRWAVVREICLLFEAAEWKEQLLDGAGSGRLHRLCCDTEHTSH